MLPGLGDRAPVFERRGFLDMVRASPRYGPDAAVIAVDAHLGYYLDRTLMTRMKEDIFQQYPARDITLVGVSLGGFGAVLTAQRSPAAVDELVLIAPFLGRAPLIERVRAGNLAVSPGDGPREAALLQCWRFLIGCGDTHRVTVLIGERDRFAPAVALLAELAPHVQVLRGEGGHDWSAWSSLFARFLADEASS